MTLGALHSGPGKDLHENSKMFEWHPKIPKVKSHGTGVLRNPKNKINETTAVVDKITCDVAVDCRTERLRK